MPQQQKLAWFALGICIAIILTYLALWPVVGTSRALAAFALMSAWAFAGMFYRKQPGRVNFDERDRDIHASAVKVAAGSVYLYFIAYCLTMSHLRATAGTVPVGWLDVMIWFGALVLLGSWSIAVLLLYRKEAV
jgi:hypothetical protein